MPRGILFHSLLYVSARALLSSTQTDFRESPRARDDGELAEAEALFVVVHACDAAACRVHLRAYGRRGRGARRGRVAACRASGLRARVFPGVGRFLALLLRV